MSKNKTLTSVISFSCLKRCHCNFKAIWSLFRSVVAYDKAEFTEYACCIIEGVKIFTSFLEGIIINMTTPHFSKHNYK